MTDEMICVKYLGQCSISVTSVISYIRIYEEMGTGGLNDLTEGTCLHQSGVGMAACGRMSLVTARPPSPGPAGMVVPCTSSSS